MADIDPRIALDQGGSPLDIAGTIRLGQQIQGARQEQAMLQQKRQQEMMQQQAAMERQQQLQGLLGQGGTPQEMAARAIQGGFPEEGMKLGAYGEQQATSGLNRQKQELGIIGDAASQLYASPNYATGQAIVNNLRARGINADQFESQLFEHRDNPNALKQIAAGYQMQIKDMLPKLGTLETGNAIQDRSINPVTNEIQVLGETPVQLTPGQVQQGQIAREGNQVQMRGQDLANARSLEANRIKQAETGLGPKLTEIQAKAQLYGTRAQAANDIIAGLEGKYSPLAVNAKVSAGDTYGIGGILGTVGNKMLGENEQLAEQAQRDFINAVLRQESGAVISPEEFKNAQKQYFPQPGDEDSTLKQKQDNRERAIKGFDVMSGPAGGFAKPAARKEKKIVEAGQPSDTIKSYRLEYGY